MNLCLPDNRKSCVACCGLYNVSDATKPTLHSMLEKRTDLFRRTSRSVDELAEFQELVRSAENPCSLDEEIHVCEFTGFLDSGKRIVGCLLHPSASGNGGIDLRGLCHYGSMACKAFYCPAWEELPLRYQEVLISCIDDWHLYGLVVTDVDFVLGLFGLAEERLGQPLDPLLLFRSVSGEIFRQMISWKESWPFKDSSLMRRSRYYFKRSTPLIGGSQGGVCRVLESLKFTFNIQNRMNGAEDLLGQTLDTFVRTYTG